MKRMLFKSCFTLVAGLLLATGVRAADEGIDYKTLSQPQPTETGDKIEVLELFWYGCPHCYHLEPGLKAWLKNKPDYVEFRRAPAVLGRGWVNHARAYFAAELMGVLDELHEPFFSALHDKKMRLFDDNSIADWFAAQGVDRGDFLKAYRSFIVDMKVRRVSQLGHRLGLEGVPSFVVNGKYLTSPSQTGGSKRMFQVLDHLAAMEAGVLPKAEPEPEAAPAAAAADAQADAAEGGEGAAATDDSGSAADAVSSLNQGATPASE